MGPPAGSKRRFGMEKKRRGWLRPVLAIGVLGALTGALLASPVSADFQPAHEKKHVKKIATKIARKQARTIVQTTVGPTIFIEETELQRYGPINLNLGQSRTIGTFGAASFTFTARCVDSGAGIPQGIVEITTSRNNSAMNSDDDTFDDFDTGVTAEWAEDTAANATDQQINSENDDDGFAWSPNGLVITSVGTTIVTNPQNVTADCSIAGALLIVAPGTA
jgi:hypothetical protein